MKFTYISRNAHMNHNSIATLKPHITSLQIINYIIVIHETDPKVQSYGSLKPHYSPWRVDLLASRAQLGVTRLWRVGGELKACNIGCSRPFSHFSSKNVSYKFPRSNLILKTYPIILIYIKALKTIYNTS